jgi:hypothetical protein
MESSLDKQPASTNLPDVLILQDHDGCCVPALTEKSVLSAWHDFLSHNKIILSTEPTDNVSHLSSVERAALAELSRQERAALAAPSSPNYIQTLDTLSVEQRQALFKNNYSALAEVFNDLNPPYKDAIKKLCQGKPHWFTTITTYAQQHGAVPIFSSAIIKSMVQQNALSIRQIIIQVAYGTNRQDPAAEALNTANNQSSCWQHTLSTLSDSLKAQVILLPSVHHGTLADVVRHELPGTIRDQWVYHYDSVIVAQHTLSATYQSDGVHPVDKAILLLHHMHRVARANPDCHVKIVFNDDKETILSALKDFFNHPEGRALMPENVILSLNHMTPGGYAQVAIINNNTPEVVSEQDTVIQAHNPMPYSPAQQRYVTCQCWQHFQEHYNIVPILPTADANAGADDDNEGVKRFQAVVLHLQTTLRLAIANTQCILLTIKHLRRNQALGTGNYANDQQADLKSEKTKHTDAITTYHAINTAISAQSSDAWAEYVSYSTNQVIALAMYHHASDPNVLIKTCCDAAQLVVDTCYPTISYNEDSNPTPMKVMCTLLNTLQYFPMNDLKILFACQDNHDIRTVQDIIKTYYRFRTTEGAEQYIWKKWLYRITNADVTTSNSNFSAQYHALVNQKDWREIVIQHKANLLDPKSTLSNLQKNILQNITHDAILAWSPSDFLKLLITHDNWCTYQKLLPPLSIRANINSPLAQKRQKNNLNLSSTSGSSVVLNIKNDATPMDSTLQFFQLKNDDNKWRFLPAIVTIIAACVLLLPLAIPLFLSVFLFFHVNNERNATAYTQL